MAFVHALALAVCSRPGLPALIPRSVLFGNPERTSPQISPDGRTLALCRPSKDGVVNIWVRPISGGNERMITHDRGAGIYAYKWSSDGRRILFFKDHEGDEVAHLYSTELDSGLVRDLTPFEGVRAQNLITAPRTPDEILVGLNLRDRHVFDMYRIHLTSGEVSLDTRNPGDVLSWTADQKLNIRACSALDPKDASTSIRTRSSSSSPWKTIYRVPFDQSLQTAQQNGGTSIVGFNSTGRSLVIVSAAGTDTSRLLKIDASTGRVREEITAPRGADIDSLGDLVGDEVYAVLADLGFDRIEAVGYNYQRLDWKAVDPEFQADLDALTKFHEGDFQVVSRDASDRKWVVSYVCDTGPTLFALYDRVTKKSRTLFEDNPSLRSYALAPMKIVSFRARDDMKIVGYLTLPLGVPDKGLPLVVYPHGGPWFRDRWGFDPTVQLLANRGYAVLQVNFRGSIGYGTKFLNSGTGGWGIGSMQNDITDAAHWAIAQGIADPSKIAILGGSYGGYATLSALAFTPELYTCGVDLVGPSDVSVLVDSIPDYWGPIKKRWVRRIGLDVHGPEFAREISPLYHAADIRAPLLIGHGANDPRVNLKQSEKLADEVRKQGGDVTLVVYSDEGHGFSRPENNLDFFSRVEEFLAKHLGGRSEARTQVKGSTAELK